MRHIGYAAENEVGSQVDQYRASDCREEERGFQPGSAGREQDREQNEQNEHVDEQRDGRHGGRVVVPDDLSVGEARLQRVFDLFFLRAAIVAGHVDHVQRVIVPVVFRAVRIVLHAFHMLDRGQLFCNLCFFRVRQIIDHDAYGIRQFDFRERLVHHVHADLHPGIIRQIFCQVFVDRDGAGTNCADERKNQHDDQNRNAFLHDKRRRFFQHRITPPQGSIISTLTEIFFYSIIDMCCFYNQQIFRFGCKSNIEMKCVDFVKMIWENGMNQRIALTKRLLKNSLTEMLQTQSIYQISIRELCQRAGLNRSTFYKYYGSQIDLLSEMEQDLLCSIETTLSSQADSNENLIEQIMVYLEQDIEFVRLLLNSNVDPQFPEKLLYLEPIRRMCEDLKADMTEDAYEYFYCFILHGAYELVHKWINKEKRESPAQIASLILRFIRG